MYDIKALQALVNEREADLRSARKALEEAWIQAATYKVGDVVEVKTHKGYNAEPVLEEARIARVEARYGFVSYYVNRRNKSGKWSKAAPRYESETQLRKVT
jgi:hypothetical protein